MSKAGWKKLEQHEGEDGTVCVIRMEASSGRFKATVGPDHHEAFKFEDSDLVKVRTEAKKYLEQCRLSEWTPVIFIKRPDEAEEKDHYGSWESPDLGTINFDYDRYYRAARQDGQLAWKAFEVVNPARNKFRELNQVKNLDKVNGKPGETVGEPQEHDNERYVSVPYTKERWSALRMITRRIQEINAKIREQLDQKRAEGFLDSVARNGMPLLAGPKERKAKG